MPTRKARRWTARPRPLCNGVAPADLRRSRPERRPVGRVWLGRSRCLCTTTNGQLVPPTELGHRAVFSEAFRAFLELKSVPINVTWLPVLLVMFFAACTPAWTGHDAEVSASAWAEKLRYKLVGVSCVTTANYPMGLCDVRVEREDHTIEPLRLTCQPGGCFER